MRFILKKVWLIIFLILSIYFGYSVKQNYKKVPENVDIDKELKKTATAQYLNSHIKTALEKDNIDDAKMYLNLADFLNVKIEPHLREKLKKADSGLNKIYRNAKDFTRGFFTGNSTNRYGISGSVLADFTLYGDLRDGYKEGRKYFNGESYDKFLLGISLVGIALTASEFVTLGASTPVKTGESIVKTAYKSGKISAKFSKVLEKKLAKSVDFKLLKKADFSSIGKMEKSAKEIAKSVNPKPLKTLFKDFKTLQKNTSLEDSIHLIKYADSEKDLEKIVKLSSKYKKNTRGIFKVLGKKIIRGGKLVVKYSAKLIYNIVGFLISAIGFLVSLIASLKFIIKIKNKLKQLH